MPSPTNSSPNIGNLQVGKGIVSFKKEGTSTFRDLGNVSSMQLNPKVTNLDHFTSRAGTKLKDYTIILEKSATLKIVMEEFTADNLGLMLCGLSDPTGNIGGAAASGTYTASAIADADTVTIGTKTYTFQTTLTNVDGNVHRTGTLATDLGNLAKAIDLTGIAGVDYAAAMTINADVTAEATPTTVVATARTGGTAGNAIATTEVGVGTSWGAATLLGGAAGAGPAVEIFSEDAISGELMFVGTNETGPKITAHLYNVSFTPTGNLDFISDQWGKLETTADVLAATSGPNLGKFGIAVFTNVPVTP